MRRGLTEERLAQVLCTQSKRHLAGLFSVDYILWASVAIYLGRDNHPRVVFSVSVVTLSIPHTKSSTDTVPHSAVYTKQTTTTAARNLSGASVIQKRDRSASVLTTFIHVLPPSHQQLQQWQQHKPMKHRRTSRQSNLSPSPVN